MRIGDMPLDAVDKESPRLRATAADLDAIAERLDIGGCPEHAVIEPLAALGCPLQQLDGAVDGDVFLIARDQERDRTFWLAFMVGEILQHRCDTAGDAALHVDRAPAIKKAVLDVACKRAMGPCALVA